MKHRNLFAILLILSLVLIIISFLNFTENVDFNRDFNQINISNDIDSATQDDEDVPQNDEDEDGDDDLLNMINEQ